MTFAPVVAVAAGPNGRSGRVAPADSPNPTVAVHTAAPDAALAWGASTAAAAAAGRNSQDTLRLSMDPPPSRRSLDSAVSVRRVAPSLELQPPQRGWAAVPNGASGAGGAGGGGGVGIGAGGSGGGNGVAVGPAGLSPVVESGSGARIGPRGAGGSWVGASEGAGEGSTDVDGDGESRGVAGMRAGAASDQSSSVEVAGATGGDSRRAVMGEEEVRGVGGGGGVWGGLEWGWCMRV